MTRTVGRVALLVAFAVLLAPSSAFGVAQFGATSLDANPDTAPPCPTSADCSDVLISQRSGRTPGAPIDGIVTRWRVRTSGAVTAMTFEVVRRSSPTEMRVVASDTHAVAGAGTTEFNSRIRIQAGDLLGLHATAGAMPLHTTPSGADQVDRFDPPLGDTARGPDTSFGAAELLVQADVEPDLDGDGYGDETQDLCVPSGATQAQCSGTLVGPDLRGDPDRWSSTVFNGGGQAIWSDVTGPDAAVAPADGVLVRWRVRADAGIFTPRIIRATGSGTDYQAIVSGPPTVAGGPSNGRPAVRSFPTRLPMRAGDVLGLGLAPNSQISVATSTAQFLFLPDLVDGGPAQSGGNASFLAIPIDGDLEPDADGDHYGDVTQDACPTDALHQDACPEAPKPPALDQFGAARVAVASLRWKRSSKLRIPLACPATALACSGSLKARAGKVKLGSAPFSLTTGETKSVGIRVAKKARRKLRKRKRLNVTTVVTPFGPPAVTQTVSVTKP
jgi:hypothetical protein